MQTPAQTWLGHEHCPHFRLPKSRRAWWKRKIHGNKTRDLRNENSLRNQGWHLVTIWECAMKTNAGRTWLEKRLPALLPSGKVGRARPAAVRPLVANGAK